MPAVFSMKLSLCWVVKILPESIETECVESEDGKIVTSHLTVKAKFPVQLLKYLQKQKKLKRECPISKSLNTEISMEATLID
ncbi:MAG: hypothetical protein R2794_09715 [Chitinophagales bacterium]